LFLRIAFWKILTNTSLPPPAAKGTITVIGLDGYSPLREERKIKCVRIILAKGTNKMLLSRDDSISHNINWVYWF